MAHDTVWEMPARRFWSMERNINRVMAEMDLRQVYLRQAQVSRENSEAIIERLKKELGEPAEVELPKIVRPEPDAKSKFLALTGQ